MILKSISIVILCVCIFAPDAQVAVQEKAKVVFISGSPSQGLLAVAT